MRGISAFLQRLGWHADHGDAGGHGPGNNGAGADSSPRADRYTGRDRGADTHQRAFFDHDFAAGMGARRDMSIVPDTVVMVYGAGCVQDDMRSDHGASIDDYVRANHGAKADLNVRRNHSCRVSSNKKGFAS